MIESLRRLMLLLAEGRPDAVPARSNHHRAKVERLESRCVLSIAPLPVGQLLDVVAPRDWDGGQPSQAGTIVVGEDGNFVAPLWPPTDGAMHGRFPGTAPWGSDPLAKILPLLPNESSSEGGLVDYGYNDMSNLSTFHDVDTAAPAAHGVQEMLASLRYLPRTLPFEGVNFPGTEFRSAMAGPQEGVNSGTANASAESIPTAPAKRSANGLEPSTLGQYESASSDAKLPEPSETTTSRDKSNDDEGFEGGMVALVRDVVIDDTANAAADPQAELDSLNTLPRMESAYGKFQAFEVSTTEDFLAPALTDGAMAPLDDANDVADDPARIEAPADKSLATTDALFFMAGEVDNTDFLSQPSTKMTVEEVALPDPMGSKSDLSTAKSEQESLTTRRALTLPVTSVAAAALFASAVGITRRPRSRSQDEPRLRSPSRAIP